MKYYRGYSKKYKEGWCQAGASNGWHRNTEELMKMFDNRSTSPQLNKQ